MGWYDKNNNEVISEQFNDLEYISYILNEYNPVIVSNDKMNLLNKDIEKTELDITFKITGENSRVMVIKPYGDKYVTACEEALW